MARSLDMMVVFYIFQGLRDLRNTQIKICQAFRHLVSLQSATNFTDSAKNCIQDMLSLDKQTKTIDSLKAGLPDAKNINKAVADVEGMTDELLDKLKPSMSQLHGNLAVVVSVCTNLERLFCNIVDTKLCTMRNGVQDNVCSHWKELCVDNWDEARINEDILAKKAEFATFTKAKNEYSIFIEQIKGLKYEGLKPTTNSADEALQGMNNYAGTVNILNTIIVKKACAAKEDVTNRLKTKKMHVDDRIMKRFKALPAKASSEGAA